ncbi:MAG: adenylyl-sulfate kinase, partial [Actinomycetia bacterium]|nr:adenylyl-sulfate kinase [Actinomycetes bacterium]
KLDIAIMVGGLEAFLKLLFYFFHERAWNKFKFGKKEITPFVLWFTGLPYSGKTTIADEVYESLKERNLKVERLDSKNIREIFKELGFTREEVNFHIKRVGHLASILERNGIIVIASFVSPYVESRKFIQNLSKNYVEVYMKAPLGISKQRHEERMEKSPLEGEGKSFPEEVFNLYEEPASSDIVLDTKEDGIDVCRDKVLNFIN